MKAVSARLFSAAIDLIVESGSQSLSGTTAAGLPAKILEANASTCQSGSFMGRDCPMPPMSAAACRPAGSAGEFFQQHRRGFVRREERLDAQLVGGDVLWRAERGDHREHLE